MGVSGLRLLRFCCLTLFPITPTFLPINHQNLGRCGNGCEEIGPPDSIFDDGGFCVSTIAGGSLLLAAGIGEKGKRAVNIGAMMGADQRLGVNTICDLASE